MGSVSVLATFPFTVSEFMTVATVLAGFVCQAGVITEKGVSGKEVPP